MGWRKPTDAVSLPSGVVNSFTYNGDGLRVQKQDSTGTTKHVWDGQKISLETDAGGAVAAVYTLRQARYGQLVSQNRSGTSTFFHVDALSSTRQLTDSIGSVVDKSDLYDSFGETIVAVGNTSNPFRFGGALWLLPRWRSR